MILTIVSHKLYVGESSLALSGNQAGTVGVFRGTACGTACGYREASLPAGFSYIEYMAPLARVGFTSRSLMGLHYDWLELA